MYGLEIEGGMNILLKNVELMDLVLIPAKPAPC